MIDVNELIFTEKVKNSKEISDTMKLEIVRYVQTLETLVNNLSKNNVMLTLPNNAEIDDIVHLKGTHKNTEFALMCMKEGAKLLRDRLRNS